MWQLLVLALGALAANALNSASGQQRGGSTMRRIYYRTRDGQNDYEFSIESQGDGTYRTYIVSQPGYGMRTTGAHETHRLTDGSGRKYVCWTGQLRSEGEARHVAATWADATQEYIKTGRRF
jgi:hypothetical protein